MSSSYDRKSIPSADTDKDNYTQKSVIKNLYCQSRNKDDLLFREDSSSALR